MDADRLLPTDAAQIEAAGGEPISLTVAEIFYALTDLRSRVLTLEREVEALRK